MDSFNNKLLTAINQAEAEGSPREEILGSLVAFCVKTATRYDKNPTLVHRLIDFAFALLDAVPGTSVKSKQSNLN